MRMMQKEQVSTLWQTVFHDTDEFVNLYFNRVYKSENTLVIEKEGRLVSMLQMIPYEMKVDETTLSCAYICGVCTHPSEQGKGYMKALMKQAMDTMRERGFAVTTLIPAEPWLFDFYKRFGYAIPVNVGVEEYTETDFTNATGKYTIVPCSAERCFSYFDSRQRERKCAILHDGFDFETVCLDCIADGGNVWVAFDKELPVGMAFEVPSSDRRVFVKEILYDNMLVKRALIRHIITYRHATTAHVRVPFSTGQKPQTYGLACVLQDTVMPVGLENLYMTLMLD